MPKYSLIVPVYNTEKYIKKCLDSILNQSYKDFELIIVNDGSTDDSMNVIKKYGDKRIIILDQKNQGLSEARNNGADKANGDYIIFIDSDDYIDKDLLLKLSTHNDDVIRFQLCTETEDYKLIEEYKEKDFSGLSGNDAFKTIATYKFVEPACIYAYKNEYFKSNKFKYSKGKYHEDFGLTPLIIIKAKTVSSINYIGYHYVQRNGSIMAEKNYAKEVKKAFDMLEQYEVLVNKINDETINDKSCVLSFLANSVIIKLKSLRKTEFDSYYKRLKELNAFDYVKTDTIKRKLKKLLMKINIKLYLKVIK